MEAGSQQGEVNLAPFFLSELKMVSRSARAAYLSVGTLVVPLSRSFTPLGVPAVEVTLGLGLGGGTEASKVDASGFGEVVKMC